MIWDEAFRRHVVVLDCAAVIVAFLVMLLGGQISGVPRRGERVGVTRCGVYPAARFAPRGCVSQFDHLKGVGVGGVLLPGGPMCLEGSVRAAVDTNEHQ